MMGKKMAGFFEKLSQKKQALQVEGLEKLFSASSVENTLVGFGCVRGQESKLREFFREKVYYFMKRNNDQEFVERGGKIVLVLIDYAPSDKLEMLANFVIELGDEMLESKIV